MSTLDIGSACAAGGGTGDSPAGESPTLRERERADLETRVSYVITNYNGRDCLPSTLTALFRVGDRVDEVIVVDDGSTDDSVSWLAREWPQVKVVLIGQNSANICKVRNRGLTVTRNRYVFLMDNDITLQKDCVSTLLQVLRDDKRILCATPRLLDEDNPDLIYADGNRLHFLALSGKPARRMRLTDRPIAAPFQTFGGGIMLIDTHLASSMGLFDEGYVGGWGDDGEFQLRAQLTGLRAVHVSAASSLHKAKVHGARRAYGQMHNRYRLIATVYQRRSILALGPSLLLFELMIVIAALLQGFSPAYRDAVASLWRERQEIGATRARLQSARRLRDSEILHGGAFEIPGAMPDRAVFRWIVAVLSTLVDLNWRLVRRWL